MLCRLIASTIVAVLLTPHPVRAEPDVRVVTTPATHQDVEQRAAVLLKEVAKYGQSLTQGAPLQQQVEDAVRMAESDLNRVKEAPVRADKGPLTREVTADRRSVEIFGVSNHGSGQRVSYIDSFFAGGVVVDVTSGRNTAIRSAGNKPLDPDSPHFAISQLSEGGDLKSLGLWGIAKSIILEKQLTRTAQAEEPTTRYRLHLNLFQLTNLSVPIPANAHRLRRAIFATARRLPLRYRAPVH